MAIRTTFNLGEAVRASHRDFPINEQCYIRPGDLTKFSPRGNQVYGFQETRPWHPIMSAPEQEGSGGVLYFDSNFRMTDFVRMLGLLEVKTPSKDYAVFIAESATPRKDGYLVQMRVVTKFALSYIFRAINDAGYENWPAQQLTIGEVLQAFIKHERKRWGMSFMQDEETGLAGLFGGDSDMMREQLAFGFMLENEDGVYRIWSRAWLVTK